MKHLLYTPLIVVFLLIGCQDDPAPQKQKPTDQPQTPTSLEGSVWVHHPDTDTNSNNWFNVGHNFGNFKYNPHPLINSIDDLKITFNRHNITDNIDFIARTSPNMDNNSDHYLYGYNPPYIRIFRHIYKDYNM